MSDTAVQTPAGSTGRADAEPTPPYRRGRAAIITVLLVSLLTAAATRDLARVRRAKATTGASAINTGGNAPLSSMNSFTLALLLGGLRGPLVMILWTSSETQKQDKNLEDFDTKVELIRLLQPEFDSVLLFQIWNKAYNISVQMSSLHNKYTTILDAIEYGQSALRARPDNINLVSAVADVYFSKLGNSAEKQYYRAQVRKESLPRKVKSPDGRRAPGWRRTQLDPLLNDKGLLDPKYLTPTRERPEHLKDDQPFNNGSELQYIKQFEPFPYGVSPLAIGYNYYMQAQTLQRVTHARHAQTSDMVVDSRPAIALKFWAEEEQELGRRHEFKALGLSPTIEERIELELPAADIALDRPVIDQAKLDEAIYNYQRAAQLSRSAIQEYNSHLKKFAGSLLMYQSHTDGLAALEHFSLADEAYLRVMQSTGEQRQRWVEIAGKEYEEAIKQYLRITLKYYTDDNVLSAVLPGTTREQIDAMPLQPLMQAMGGINQAIARGMVESHGEDRREYETYVQRAILRLHNLEKR